MKTCFIDSKDSHHFVHSFPCVLAIGFFDGVHRGHQKVIQTAVKIAQEKNLKVGVMTFSPHPREVIGKEKVERLSTFSQKEALIRELGVDYLYVVAFNRNVQRLPPELFVKDYILRLQAKHVVVGFDFTYGAFGKGNVHRLREDGGYSFDVTVIDKIEHSKLKVSSTFIRKSLGEGKLERVTSCLGYHYKTIGFLHYIDESKLVFNNHQNMLPKSGEYEAIVKYGDYSFHTNIYCENFLNNVYVSHFHFFPVPSKEEPIEIQWLHRISANTLQPFEPFIVNL